MITRDVALKILEEHMPNKNLLKHCLAVEFAMRALYRHLTPTDQQVQDEEDLWGLVGLMHDADWEETRGDFTKHTTVTVEWLKQAGETDERIFNAILAHNYNHNQSNPPKDNLEWSLYICDELTGFIVAVALILPEKKLEVVTAERVLKMFPKQKFAAGVHREQIKLCEEKLGIKLEDFVGIVLKAMQQHSIELGL